LAQKKNAGRNKNTGRLSAYRCGGGVSRLLRRLRSRNTHFYGIHISSFYDPKRKSFISVIFNLLLKKFFYINAVNNLSVGSLVVCSTKTKKLILGSKYTLSIIPLGSFVSNVSTTASNISQYIRAPGAFGQLLQKDKKQSKIKMPSGKILTVNTNSFGVLGIVSNLNSSKTRMGKAGLNRLQGRRPSVRGIAMNPVDHPHGGRANGGKPSVTPWGWPTRGQPTVNKK